MRAMDSRRRDVSRDAASDSGHVASFSPRPPLQRAIGAVGSTHERRADRVADAVAPGGSPAHVDHQSEASPRAQRLVGSSIDALAGGGRPLPMDMRAYFETRLARDLSDVRVHTDPRATRAAAAVGARAFAWGDDIAFGAGQWQPGTAQGRWLIAHELAHVSDGTPFLARAPTDAGPLTGINFGRLETLRQLLNELDRVGSQAASGEVEINVGGQARIIANEDIEGLRALVADRLRSSIKLSRMSIGHAQQLHGFITKNNTRDWSNRIVSWTVEHVGGVDDPGPEIARLGLSATEALDAAAAAVEAGSLRGALDLATAGEARAKATYDLARRYGQETDTVAERQMNRWEATRTASFVSMGVIATIASGGATAGAGASAFGVTLPATVGGATAAIAIAAPAVAASGEALMKLQLGQPVDLKKLGIDALVSIVTARVGGSVAARLFKRMGGDPRFQGMGIIAFRRAFASVAAHEGATAFRGAVDASYAALSGKPVTIEAVVDDIVRRLSDPAGLFAAALLGASGGVVEVRTARRAIAGDSPPPVPAERKGPPAFNGRVPPTEAEYRDMVGTPLVRAMLEQPVSAATLAQLRDFDIKMAPRLVQLRAAQGYRAQLTPEQRTALEGAERALDELRWGPSNTASRDNKAVDRLRKAAEFTRDAADEGQPLTTERLQELNAMIRGTGTAMPKGPPREPLRTGAVYAGYKEYIATKDVPGELAAFGQWYNATRGKISPVELAARSYQRLVTIHPFKDGNGRATRMAMDWILRQGGLPETPFHGKTEHNVAVYEIVAKAQLNGSQPTPDEVTRALMQSLVVTIDQLVAALGASTK